MLYKCHKISVACQLQFYSCIRYYIAVKNPNKALVMCIGEQSALWKCATLAKVHEKQMCLLYLQVQ